MSSVQDQILEMEKDAQERGYEIVDVCSESQSAKEPGRSGFNEMLKRLQRGEAQGILCWKLNRLARNPVDGGQVSWLLQKGIIQHIHTRGQDYRPSDNVLMMQVEFGMANQFVKDLSVDIRRGMRQKAQRGWFCASKPPLGYKHNPDKQFRNGKEIISDDESFPIVKQLWRLMLSGKYSVAGIMREANQLGLRNSLGRTYSKQTFFGMLTNEFYCGFFYWYDQDGNSQRFKGKHEALVSVSEFEKVQNILHRKSFKYPQKSTTPFAYSCLISCGECGRSITTDTKLQAICPGCKHKFSIKRRTDCPRCSADINQFQNVSIVNRTYLKCTKYKTSCSQPSIQPEDLENQMIRVIQGISISQEIHDWILHSLKEFQKEDDSKEIGLVTQLKKKISELESRLDSLVQLRADREITAQELVEIRGRTNREKQDLESKLQELTRTVINWEHLAKEHLNYSLQAESTFINGDSETKRKMMQNVLSNLVLRDKKLYAITQKATKAVASCSEVYVAIKPSIEPENSVTTYGDFNDLHPLRKVLWSRLNDLRTCLIDIKLTEREKRS